MSAIYYPAGMPDAIRAATSVSTAAKRVDGAKGLAAMLLAAMVAALVVLADQLISTWADEHLLVAWIALWVVGFAAIGLLASTSRSLAGSLLLSWAEKRELARRRHADERMWEAARHDSRLMADLQAAITRAQGE